MCLSHANVVLCVLCVACIDGCFVYNVLTHALAPTVTVLCTNNFLWLAFSIITRVLWLVIIDLTLLIISDNSFLDMQ